MIEPRTPVPPLVSILIPSYNYAQYITTAIDAVLGQTYPNIEIVVTDNQSTDGTFELLEERYRGEPRLRLFRNERNIGLVPNFNRALGHARGEFVGWLCADDWILPRHVERLRAVFAAQPQIDVVYSRTYVGDARGNVFAVKGDPSLFPTDYVDLRDELPPMLTACSQVCLPGALFRRELFGPDGAFDESMRIVADWDLSVRLAMAGKRFAYLAEPSACVRAHGGSASAIKGDTNSADDLLTILERVLAHPASVRLRGYELGVIGFMDLICGELRPLDPSSVEPRRRRIATVRERLLQSYSTYEPARVREHRVSVVIPMTARPVALMSALDAVERQTFRNWDVLLVDQGSVPVGELVQAHPAAARISHVRLVPERPAGGARSLAMEMIRGEYVAFLDEDNVIAPDHLERLVATIASTGADVAVASARLVVDELAHTTYRSLTSVDGIFRGPEDPDVLGAVANAMPLNAILHHRRFYFRAGGFNATVRILEDFDYLMRLQSTARLAFCNSVTLDVHVRLGFDAQALGAYAPLYLTTLDALYAAREVSAEITALRAAHRVAVVDALERRATLGATVDGIVEFVRALAGRAVVPEQSRLAAERVPS